MKPPPPLAGRQQGSDAGMKDVALLKVTALLIVSLQPGGCRMRPSFGGCYVACSSADTLEKLNLGVKQAQCYTPSQDSL